MDTPKHNRSPLTRRLQHGLAQALGPLILDALRDEAIVEVMVNPDHAVWIDHREKGRVRFGEIPRERVEAVIRLVAAHVQRTVNRGHASISAMLPDLFKHPITPAFKSNTTTATYWGSDPSKTFGGGLRFQGVWPPLVASPSFVIRKLSAVVWGLDDYSASEIASRCQVAAIREATAGRKNILVAGGTGSGKTTLLNSCLAEPGFTNSRVVMLEDTAELDFVGDDSLRMVAEPPVTIRDLLKKTLRMRPDRIVVGEVRGSEAYEMLKAWNTGHPGGLCSLHANGLIEALHRLQDLANEHAPISMQKIVDVIDLVVFIRRDTEYPKGRVIDAVGVPVINKDKKLEMTKIIHRVSD